MFNDVMIKFYSVNLKEKDYECIKHILLTPFDKKSKVNATK